MTRTTSLILFLLAVVGGGLTIGYVTAPGAWYAGLQKPSFTPPDWLFAPVWIVLYVLIALAGWRTWLRAPRSAAMRLWWVQMVLNFLWSPVFFGAHLTGPGLLVILALLAAVLGFIAASARRDALVAWMFVPYALWVGFASALNAAILVLN